MTDLSPAAQAVMDAYLRAPCDNKLSVAAALRATAEQLLKEDDAWFEKTDGTLERLAIEWVPFHSILSIVRELEQLDD
jgi:hypothetical protein